MTNIISDKYGQVDLGEYVVNNNAWNTNEAQELELTEHGFKVTRAAGSVPPNGPPKSYPSIYYGAHYGRRSKRTILPLHADTMEFSALKTSATMVYPTDDAVFDASYDCWFDQEAKLTGQNTGAELMVWLAHRGAIQPIGSKVTTALSLPEIDGTWDVWYGRATNGDEAWNCVSYLATQEITSVSFPLRSFYRDLVQRGYASKDWYLTSVQAGFEPWSGGVGLAVTDFKVSQEMLPE